MQDFKEWELYKIYEFYEAAQSRIVFHSLVVAVHPDIDELLCPVWPIMLLIIRT